MRTLPIALLASLTLASVAEAQMGRERAARHFGERPFRAAFQRSWTGDGFVQLVVYVAESEDLGWSVVVARHRAGGREWVDDVLVHHRYLRPRFRAADRDFGPGLLRFTVTTRQDPAPPERARAGSRRRRADPRRFGEEKAILLAFGPERGLEVVREIVHENNSIAGARATWDPRARTLTVVTQPRNPPGRERCRRPRARTRVERWDGDRFVEVSDDPPSHPCH